MPDEMPDERQHESADLRDYEVDDASDTLDGDPGDDPLDRGVVPPQHWSAAMRSELAAEDQGGRESLDQLLAEEEPDIGAEPDDLEPGDIAGDPDAADEDVDGLLLDDGPAPRAGWWPRTRAPTRTRRPTLSRVTSASTAARRPRRRRRSTWSTTTMTTSAPATDADN